MGTDLDRLAYHPPAMMSEEETRSYAAWLAGTKLVPEALQGEPDHITLVGAMGAEVGLTLLQAIQGVDVIDNKPVPNAQTKMGQIRRAGHEARWLVTTYDRAVLTVRRRENRADPEAWLEIEWTTEMAERAGMLDEWVQRWVEPTGNQRKGHFERVRLRREGDKYVRAEFGATEIPDWAQKDIAWGKVRRHETWWTRRQNMLRAACARDAHRMEFSDLAFGDVFADLHHLVEGPEDVGELGVDEIIDAVLVEPTRSGGETEDEMYDRHRKRALARLGEAGIKGNDARHAAVCAATRGRTSSTKRLSAQDVADIVAWCDARPDVSEGEAETEGGGGSTRENGAGDTLVVESPVAVPVPPTSSEGWRSLARECGVTQIDVLRRARDIAGEMGLSLPDSLADIDDVSLAEVLAAWVRSGHGGTRSSASTTAPPIP